MIAIYFYGFSIHWVIQSFKFVSVGFDCTCVLSRKLNICKKLIQYDVNRSTVVTVSCYRTEKTYTCCFFFLLYIICPTTLFPAPVWVGTPDIIHSSYRMNCLALRKIFLAVCCGHGSLESFDCVIEDSFMMQEAVKCNRSPSHNPPTPSTTPNFPHNN